MSLELLREEFNTLCPEYEAQFYSVDLCETIEFKTPVSDKKVLEAIQTHFAYLGLLAVKCEQGILHYDAEFTGELTIYGDGGYSTNGNEDFIYTVLNELDHAEGFKIVSEYHGPYANPNALDENSGYAESEAYMELEKMIPELGKTEKFEYSYYKFVHNNCNLYGDIAKFKDGQWVDLKNKYSKELLDKDFGEKWDSEIVDLDVKFDFEKYPKILKELQDCVRKHVPKDQLEYCESDWEGGDVEILCSSIFWPTKKLRKVQNFLDDVNEIIKPIMKECDCWCQGVWSIEKAPYARATWEWTDEGFKVVGFQL